MADEAILLKIKALVDGATSVDDLARKLDGLRGASARPIQDPTGPLKEGADQTALSLDDLSVALKAVVGAAIAKDFVDTAAQFEAMQKGLESLTGSSEAARVEMDYITRTADTLGISVKDAAASYVSLSAATKGTALEGQNTRAIFEAVSSAMAKLGKSSAETQQALNAIAQMASKGTVSMEELRGQLGEALPGAMQAAARAMGVTVAELDKMIASGTISAEELLPKLAAELNKTFGTEPPDTLSAAFARLQNKIDLAYKTFGETGSMEAFSTALKAVGEVLEKVTITASGAWEAFELLGKGFGAWFAAIQQALSGDLIGAFNGFKANMAEAMDAAATDINKVKEAMTETGAAVQGTQPIIGQTADAATRLAEQLKGVGTAGTTSADAIGKAFASLDLTTPAGVTAMVDAFTLLGDKTREADLALAAYLAKMNAADLSAFRQQIETLYQGGQIEAARFVQLNDQVLAASFAQLGLTAETALGRIGPAAGNAIASLDGIRVAIADMSETSTVKMRALGEAVSRAIDVADNEAAISALRERIIEMGQSGELSAAQVELAMNRLADSTIAAFERMQSQSILDGEAMIGGLREAMQDISLDQAPELGRALAEAFDQGRISQDQLNDLIKLMATRLKESKNEADAMFQSGQMGAEQYKQKLLELANVAGVVGQQMQNVGQKQAPQLEQVKTEAEGAAGGLQQVSTQQQNVSQTGGEMVQGMGVVIDTTNDLTESTSSAGAILSSMVKELDVAVSKISELSSSAGQAVEALRQSGKGFKEWTQEVANLNAMDFVGNNPMAELSREAEVLGARVQEASAAMEELSQRAMFAGTMQPWYEGLRNIISFERGLASAKLRLNEFERAQLEVNQAFDQGNISLAEQEYKLKQVEMRFRDLGDENLQTLRDAIQDVEDKLDDMSDAAASTLADLQDELDQMNGNLDEIEQRRAQQKLADIQAKIDEAQAAGNKQAVSDLQKALALQQQINDERIKEAKLREEEQKQAEAERKRVEAASKTTPATPGVTPPTASAAAQAVTPVKTVNVRLTMPDGRSTTVQTVAGSEDALLDALETLGYRS